jgi:hypothetical protein
MTSFGLSVSCACFAFPVKRWCSIITDNFTFCIFASIVFLTILFLSQPAKSWTAP